MIYVKKHQMKQVRFKYDSDEDLECGLMNEPQKGCCENKNRDCAIIPCIAIVLMSGYLFIELYGDFYYRVKG